MANVRTEQSPPIPALNAETVIPAEKITGDSYRDVTLTTAEIETGFKYNDLVDESKLINQYRYLMAQYMAEVESSGVLPWSPNSQYLKNGLATASDNKLYRALQPNTNVNPLSDPTTWQSLDSVFADDYILDDLSNANTTGTGTTIVVDDAPELINPIVGTQPNGTNNDLAASTAFVKNALILDGQDYQYAIVSFNSSTLPLNAEPWSATYTASSVTVMQYVVTGGTVADGRYDSAGTIDTSGKTIRYIMVMDGKINPTFNNRFESGVMLVKIEG